MPPNPVIERQLREARAELERLRAEKLKRFPPNPHPFVQRDRFPYEATPEEIRLRNELIARIEALEQLVEELEERLYTR